MTEIEKPAEGPCRQRGPMRRGSGRIRGDGEPPTVGAQPRPPTRRRVLTLLGGAAALLSLGASRGRSKRRPGRQHAGRQEALHVGSLSDVPETDALEASYHGLPLLLFRLEDEVKAVSGMCTHEGCSLGWNADRRVILCPCHGGEFDPTGAVLSGPPPAALVRFPVHIDEGEIYVLDPQQGD